MNIFLTLLQFTTHTVKHITLINRQHIDCQLPKNNSALCTRTPCRGTLVCSVSKHAAAAKSSQYNIPAPMTFFLSATFVSAWQPFSLSSYCFYPCFYPRFTMHKASSLFNHCYRTRTLHHILMNGYYNWSDHIWNTQIQCGVHINKVISKS